MDIKIASSFSLHPVEKQLEKIREDYTNNRFTFVPGEMMKEIIRYFGATEKDIRSLQYSGDRLGNDPTLPFRKSRNGRFLIDFEKRSLSRLNFQPFVLSKEEDFVRDDSGKNRSFRGIQDEVQANTAFQGLLKFKASIIEEMDILPRPDLQNMMDKWVSTVFQLRTITNPKLIGAPAKEGVHSDGVEHTMTTFLYSRNMSNESAISKVHINSEVTGTHWADVDEKLVVGKHQHRHYLDTLLIVDTELKHSVSDVYAVDNGHDAIRDMVIFFTRRPKANTHSTYSNDPLHPHLEIPMEIVL